MLNSNLSRRRTRHLDAQGKLRGIGLLGIGLYLNYFTLSLKERFNKSFFACSCSISSHITRRFVQTPKISGKIKFLPWAKVSHWVGPERLGIESSRNYALCSSFFDVLYSTQGTIKRVFVMCWETIGTHMRKSSNTQNPGKLFLPISLNLV